MSKGVKVAIYCLFFLFSSQLLTAQLEAGIKAGVSNYSIANPIIDSITFRNNNIDEYRISVKDVNLGYHFGLYSRLQVWKIILQAEAVINSSSVSYKVEDISDFTEDVILTEQYTTLDIPLVLGLKLGWFNLQGGVSGHMPISSVSELKDLDGYEANPPNFEYSYLGGFGIDIWRLRFDMRYELSTTFFGDHITYKGEKYQFADQENRIILGLAYKF